MNKKQEPIKEIEKLLVEKRGYVSKFPDNKKCVMIISGGLDSTITAARLIEDYNMEIYPLHIKRGQTNFVAEEKSVDYYTKYFTKKYGKDKFHTPTKISVNIPPQEFKKEFSTYVVKQGYPMRDPIMQLVGVEYAVSVSQKFNETINTIYCAIVPEDYFPHSSLVGLRATTLATCINMGEWNWQITSPNIDMELVAGGFDKKQEITWAMKHKLPLEHTISCNVAGEKTNFRACGHCKSCTRRHDSFINAGFEDPTLYYEKYTPYE